jgi:hypothetical protein
VVLLQLVQKMVMEMPEMIFIIASKFFACASFSNTLFNDIKIAVFLSISAGRIESDKFKVGKKYDSDEDFICAVIKDQLGHEESLSDDEATAIVPWKFDPESDQDILEKPLSLN